MPRDQVEPPPESGSGFDEYYRSDDTRLLSFVLKLGATLHEAQDTVQEAMTEVFKKWERMTNPAAYARTVAERRFLRSRARAAQEIEKLAQSDWATATVTRDPDIVILKEEARQVIAVMQLLPYEQRRVLAWHLDGFEIKEIAAMLKRPESTVRSNLRHARARVKEMLASTRPSKASTERGADDDRPGR